MEVIEIGKTKLIFVLDRDDVNKYKIDTEAGSAIPKDSFSRLVSDLGVGEQFLSGVLVQIFDAIDGGCEMFITKISDDTDNTKELSQNEKKHVYIFPALPPLLSCCRMLDASGAKGGQAYIDKAAKCYYLLLDCDRANVCEYLGTKCRDGTEEFVTEHCSLISDRAIPTLSHLA